jgi:DNA ligase-associated metallophosphoesterase
MKVTIRGEDFLLLPQRVAFRIADRTLLAADLHWGKSEIFQRHGIAVSSQVLNEDLARLSSAILETDAQRLLILGDLIHAPMGLTPEVIQTVRQWREVHLDLKIELIRGNHDRLTKWPESWRIEVHTEPIVDEPFLFAHDPPLNKSHYAWLGHMHPVVVLSGAGDRLRLPCFVIDKDEATLPAFGSFTGGHTVKGSRSRKIYAIADDTVIEI